MCQCRPLLEDTRDLLHRPEAVRGREDRGADLALDLIIGFGLGLCLGMPALSNVVIERRVGATEIYAWST